jgi:hypothetical protein
MVFFLSCVVVLLVIYGSNQFNVLPNLIVWTAICLFSIIDTLLRNVSLFFVHMDLNEALVEMKKMEEENRTNELRSMIGNVAHDLKTVSSLLLPY